MTPKELITFVKENNVEFIDLRFIDLPGVWQHFSIPAHELTEDIFEEGAGFDGSSIRGFQGIQESDMLLFPDAGAHFMDSFTKVPTLNLICDIGDPITRERYTKDPRYVSQKAENYLNSTGIGDTIYFGPEAEFFIFDDIRFNQTYNQGFYYIDSEEGFWNSGREENPNLGYKPRYKEGYFPVPPMDSQQDVRSEMVMEMEKAGIDIEIHHHEVGTAGQAEIDMRFDTMTRMADKLITYKYIVKKCGETIWQNGDLYAKAHFRGQWIRNALPPEHLEGWEKHLLRTRLCRIERRSPLVHWRIVGTRSGLVRIYHSDHQLLSTVGTRLRSAYLFALFSKESQRGMSDSDVFQQ